MQVCERKQDLITSFSSCIPPVESSHEFKTLYLLSCLQVTVSSNQYTASLEQLESWVQGSPQWHRSCSQCSGFSCQLQVGRAFHFSLKITHFMYIVHILRLLFMFSFLLRGFVEKAARGLVWFLATGWYQLVSFVCLLNVFFLTR